MIGESANDLDHVGRVTMQSCVLPDIIGAEVGPAAADQVITDGLVAFAEFGLEESSHVLVETEAMRENHRVRAIHADVHAMTLLDTHLSKPLSVASACCQIEIKHAFIRVT
ncbi:MAG: hypothetical protein ABI748_05200 [Dokdonella sp.]